MALIAEEYGDRVGFFTILSGFNDDKDTALRITEAVNAPFITVGLNTSIAGAFGRYFESGYIPETLLIDGNGNIIESIVGGSADEYRIAIERALEEVRQE